MMLPGLTHTLQAYQKDVLTKGLAASPGAAVGRLVFTADEAEAWKARGKL